MRLLPGKYRRIVAGAAALIACDLVGARTDAGRSGKGEQFATADSSAVLDTIRKGGFMIIAVPDTSRERRRHYPPPKPGLGADVRVVVKAKISKDKESRSWTYSYTLENLRTSPRAVWSFSLEPIGIADSISGPKGWTPMRSDSLVNWFCTDPGPPPLVDDGNVHPSPFDLYPGSSATFRFTSPFPPGDSITFFAHGFQPIPEPHTPTEEDSILNTKPSFFMDSRQGKAIGPRRSTRKGRP